MPKETPEGFGNTEMKALKNKAETIKKDTLEFINSAKNLSKIGFKDAKHLVNFAKANWKSVLGVAAALGIGGAILTKKRKTAKSKSKTKTTKKKAAKSRK